MTSVAQHATLVMIKSFRHKGLRLFFETGSRSGVNPQHADKLQMQLSALHTAQDIADMDIPGYNLHKLKGNMKTLWSVSVNKNWRLTFEFVDGDVFIVNYEDYH